MSIAAALSVPSHADDAYRLLDLGGHAVKWGKPQLGTGAVITYRLANDETSGGTVNCRSITSITPLLSRARLSQPAFDRALEGAMHAWSATANVRFVRITNDSADLTIGAEQTPDGIAYTDVTPSSQTSASIATPQRAVVCLNPRVKWTLERKRGNAKVLGYVLEHEIGHALGLDHPGPSGELMSFEYSDKVQSLQPGDIAGIVVLYGKPAHAGAIALNASPPR